MNKKQKYIVLGLAIAAAMIGLWSTSVGAVTIPFKALFSVIAAGFGLELGEYLPEHYTVFWVIRFPRILMALMVGAVLAVTGAAMQGLFRNPLADPSIIGVAGGGAMMAAIFIVIGGGGLMLALPVAGDVALIIFTFIGALLTTLLVFTISIKKGKSNVATMLLAGIAINALAGAVTGFLTYIANDEQLRDLTFWTMGSLGGANWQKVGLFFLLNAFPVFVLLQQHKGLNALTLGESQANHLGVNVGRLKKYLIICVAIAMASTVAFCGIIGFVGLVVPHILRTAAGPNNRYVLLGSLLGGMVLLTLADTFARTLVTPAEIPIGIITSLAGAPVFLSLLIRNKLKNTL